MTGYCTETNKRSYKLDATLTPVNLQKAGLDATKEVYKNLPLREVKLVSMGGGEGSGGLATLLPQISEAFKATSLEK